MNDAARDTIALPFLIASAISVFFILWFAAYQTGTEQLISLTSKSAPTTPINSFIRVVSHVGTTHLLGNVQSIFIFTLLLGSVMKNRHLIEVIGAITVIATVTTAFYPKGVGASSISMGLLGAFTIIIIYWSITRFKSRLLPIILIGLVLGVILFSNLPLDIFVLLDIVSLEDPGIFSDFITIPANYGYSSSILHTAGFISGLGLGSVMITIDHFTDRVLFYTYTKDEEENINDIVQLEQ